MLSNVSSTLPSTYETVASFAQTWGLSYFVLVFVAAFAWTLWPSRKEDFEAAARLPLTED